MKAKKRVGLYLDAGTILQQPGYLELLRDALGLNLVILNFSGKLSDGVLAKSPFDQLPPSDETIRSLLCRHIDGQPSTAKLGATKGSVGPHMHAGGDDEALRQAIARAHAAGMEVWMLGGAWTANDFDVLMYCPSHEAVNTWYGAVYTHLATAYEVEGVDITHARFPMTSYPRGMFLCACDRCAREAAERGYDMERMKGDILHARERIRGMEGDRLAQVCMRAMGPFDALQLLGMRQGVMEWFTFRCELLAVKFGAFRDAVHEAAGEDFIFGTDTYPASLSPFVGHDHTRWDTFSDFASPLLSHVDIFPMQTMTAWAQFLQALCPDLDESQALQMIYRLVGYDDLGMPRTIEEFALGAPDCEFRNVPLRDLVALDMAKARLYLPADIPSYPIIQGGGAPHHWPRETIEEIMAAAEETGHQGIIFQGVQSLVDVEE